MRLILALGVAAAATTVAYAQTAPHAPSERTHVFVSHGGPGGMDANDDGWVTRAEASAGADRMFEHMDRNDDNRLNEADRPPMEDIDIRIGGPGHAPEVDDDNCDRTETGSGNDRRVTIICRDEHSSSESGERRIVRRHGDGDHEVIIRRSGGEGGDAVVAPMPPHPPHPPMMWLSLDDDSEADTNNDGAISQDEFRTMQLRLFDARDVNGDGRIRAPRPPEPPEPPTPPTPPSPPRRG